MLKPPRKLEAQGIPPKKVSDFNRYLAIVAAICATFLGCAYGAGTIGGDHFAALSLNGDPSWFLDIGGKHVTETQDFDLFYHNIGHSITEARKADVVLLGPSFVAYALDPELLRQFGARHGITIYNMSFIGVRSGEFSRLVIRRWDLHPKLWIINVDDQFTHFFSKSLSVSFGSQAQPIPAVSYNRLNGWLRVAGRNLRWRFEDLLDKISGENPTPVPDGPQRLPNGNTYLEIYRKSDDGGFNLSFNPRYFAPDNSVIQVGRDQNCHTDPKTIRTGLDYLEDIGGQSLLMLVPNWQYCPRQAQELAEALDVEALLAPDAAYTTVDKGGHLDHKGAVAFTEFLLSALERSAAFKGILATSPSAVPDQPRQ